MVDPVYVPFLPVRRDAWRAYERLDADVRRLIAPLWTVVPRIGPERLRGDRRVADFDDDTAALDRWLTGRIDAFLKETSGAAGWVDAVHVERLVEASAIGLGRLATESCLCLVTGPERDPILQRYTADLAFPTGRGLGIRILLDKPSAKDEEARSTGLLELVDRVCLPPSQLDLLLDLGPVMDAADASKTALAALDLLGGLLPWRTVVLAAGAFPRTLGPIVGSLPIVIPRHDRQIAHLVRASRPDVPGHLLYGDYSTEHALSANIPSADRFGPAWGLLRYTAPETFLVAPVPTRGPHRADRVRAGARRIAEAEAFRSGASDGERWLDACAYGEGSDGTGNAETWIRVGHTQHMSFVVAQLTGDGARRGRS
jgi:Beta protein